MRTRGPRGSPVRLHRRRRSAIRLLCAARARCHSIERTAARGDCLPRLLLGGVLRARLLRANAGRLPAELAEVVELRAADLAAPHDRDVADHGAVHREDALDADPIGYL